MKNLGLKAFSVFVALLLALYVHSSSNTVVRTFVATIELSRVPDRKVVLAPLNPTVLVTLRGPSFVMSKVPNSPPVFSVTLPANVENKYRVSLDPADLKLPAHLEVGSIEPQVIEFTLDDLIEKDLSIVVPRIGAIEEAVRVDSITTDPEKVAAIGPRSELKDRASIETEAIDLRTIHGDTTLALGFRSPPSLSHLSKERVAVAIKLVPIVIEKRFENIPLEARGLTGDHSRLELEPKTINLTLKGPKSILSGVTRSALTAYATVPEKVGPKFEATISVERPAGVDVVEIEPSNARLMEATKSMPKKERASGKSNKAR